MQVRAYSVGEACSQASCGRTTLYGAIRRGELTARKRGKRTLILADDLNAWIASWPEIASKAANDDIAQKLAA